uniref:Uncharacterized protein n=1 Tax=Anopheles coluzzii TaxID=1518534 RepID=A0A8W7P2Z8_ANOCL
MVTWQNEDTVKTSLLVRGATCFSPVEMSVNEGSVQLRKCAPIPDVRDFIAIYEEPSSIARHCCMTPVPYLIGLLYLIATELLVMILLLVPPAQEARPEMKPIRRRSFVRDGAAAFWLPLAAPYISVHASMAFGMAVDLSLGPDSIHDL